MARLTKKQKEALAKIEKGKIYSVDEASALIKDITNTKFDSSIDLAIRLGVDPRKANQMVRGVSIFMSSTMSPSLAIDPKIG